MLGSKCRRAAPRHTKEFEARWTTHCSPAALAGAPPLPGRRRSVCDRPGRGRPGDAGRRLHAAGRHPFDQGRRDDLLRLHLPVAADLHRRGREHHQPEFVQREPRLHQHHRQRLAPGRLPHHAGRDARERRGQLAQRQPDLPAEVRLRPGQPRRLAAQGVVGPDRASADAVHRLHRGRIPLPVPGPDLRRPRGLHFLVRLRRQLPQRAAEQLRRLPRRLLQRRELLQGRDRTTRRPSWRG